MADRVLDRARLAGLMAARGSALHRGPPAVRGAVRRRPKATLLDGVPMPWMVKWASPFPPFVASAGGAHFRCVDGHDYVDFCLGDTGAMAGHGPAPTDRRRRAAAAPWHHPHAPDRGRGLGRRRS